MATTRETKPAADILGDTVTISGSCPTVTTGAVTATGRGFAMARTTTGTYTVTFDKDWGTLLDFQPVLRRPSVDAARAIPGTWNATTRVHTIFLVGEDGTPAAADPADDADSVLSFTAKFAKIPALATQ